MVLVAAKRNVAMYFVRNEENAVLKANIAHTLYFFPCPYAPNRVMRAA